MSAAPKGIDKLCPSLGSSDPLLFWVCVFLGFTYFFGSLVLTIRETRPRRLKLGLKPVKERTRKASGTIFILNLGLGVHEVSLIHQETVSKYSYD